MIPLRQYAGEVVSFNLTSHGEAGTFLLDTGGGVTMITPEFAKLVGCNPWGRLTSHRMRGLRVDALRCDNATLHIGRENYVVPTAGVLDFAKLLPKEAPHLDGSLALDAFAGRVVTLSLADKQLTIETPASLKARIAGAAEMPVRFNHGAGGLARTPFVGLDTPRGRLWLEIDCGSDGTVIIAQHAAEALGLNPLQNDAQPLSLELAPGLSVRTKVGIEDLIIDGNIGGPILKKWVLTFDLLHDRLWVSRYPSTRDDSRMP